MPVGVERDVRLRVSEPPAHSEYVFAFGNQDRSVGVSQAVKLAPGTPALRQALYQARVTLLGDSNSPSMVCSTSFSNPAHPTTRNRFADPGATLQASGRHCFVCGAICGARSKIARKPLAFLDRGTERVGFEPTIPAQRFFESPVRRYTAERQTAPPPRRGHLFSIASVQLQECVAPISRLEFMGGSTLAERGGKGSGEFLCEHGPRMRPLRSGGLPDPDRPSLR